MKIWYVDFCIILLCILTSYQDQEAVVADDIVPHPAPETLANMTAVCLLCQLTGVIRIIQQHFHSPHTLTCSAHDFHS